MRPLHLVLVLGVLLGAWPDTAGRRGGAPVKPPEAGTTGKTPAIKTPAMPSSSKAAPPAPRLSQPIPFSHRIHAGVNGIGCLLCHAYAEHGPVAGIPSMGRCFGCHKFIDRDSASVKVLVQTYQKKKVIEWNRIYELQDFVFFTHERHIAAGLPCRTCHGEVEKMDVLRRASPLTMGWCVDCHRARGAPSECLTCHK